MHEDFYKKVFDDYIAFLRNPKVFLRKMLETFDPAWIDKKWILFVVFMNVYYILSPVYLISLNLLALISFFFGLGVFYYLCQLCLFKYQTQIGETDYDQKKLYVFAYVFGLAEITGFLLNLIIFIFNLSHFTSIFAWLSGFLFMMPVAIIVIAFKLSVFRVVEPGNFSLVSFVELFLAAIIEAMRNKFSYNAWLEIYEDFRSAKSTK